MIRLLAGLPVALLLLLSPWAVRLLLTNGVGPVDEGISE
jgi:hypothetical protein